MQKGNLLFIVFFSLFGNVVFSQTSENDWINYDQKYYEIKIVKDGLYRINGAVLKSYLGNDFNALTPGNIQLFSKGKEQVIYVNDGDDGVLDDGDYIEFYGERNSGWFDVSMYESEKHLPSPSYSFYNDTLKCFLTWNTNSIGKRFQEFEQSELEQYSAEEWGWSSATTSSQSFFGGGDQIQGAYSSKFVAGEGYYKVSLNGKNNQSYSLAIKHPSLFSSSSIQNCKLTIRTSSFSNAKHDGLGNHHIKVSFGKNNETIYDTIFTGYKLINFERNFSNTNLSAASDNILFQTIDDLGAESDWQGVAECQLIYPRVFENIASNSPIIFGVETNTQTKRRITFTGTNSVNDVVYCLGKSGSNYRFRRDNTQIDFLIPNNNYSVILNKSVNNITDLQPVNTTGYFIDYISLLPSNSFLIITHPALQSGAQMYSDYKSTIASGGFKSIVVNIEQLYNQYAYGIEKHPLAITNFIKEAQLHQKTPDFLFLLGKSIRITRENNENGSRHISKYFEENLVPSFGAPSSDILFTTSLSPDKKTPLVPTGRLSAKNNQDIFTYLSKIKDYQENLNSSLTLENHLWRKNVMQFGGGITSSEQNLFKAYINHFSTFVETPSWGGQTINVFKESSDPISRVEANFVTGRITQGVSLMTFFGHATSVGFDQEIDDPFLWRNKGRYPILLGNACYSGDMFQPTSFSTSENYIFTANAGTIGFISTVKLGFTSSLFQYSSRLYSNASGRMYGKSIGEIMKETINDYNFTANNIIAESVVYGMTLHGDPSIKFHAFNTAELLVEQDEIKIIPEKIGLNTRNILLKIPVFNIGKAVSDSILIEVRRIYPDGSDTILNQNIAKLFTTDTIEFNFPFSSDRGIGVNRFEVYIDQNNSIAEVDDIINNQTFVTKTFSLNGIQLIYPPNFAVIGDKNNSNILFSTINPDEKESNYYFEIDTIKKFVSPIKLTQNISQTGGVIEVKKDNWYNNSNQRTTLDLLNGKSYFFRYSTDQENWSNGSFTYVKNKYGWGQFHFDQFSENNLNSLAYSSDNELEFVQQTGSVSCEVYGNATTYNDYVGTLFRVNGQFKELGACGGNSALHLVVIDPKDFKITQTHHDVQNPNGPNWGYKNIQGACWRDRAQDYLIYHQKEDQMNKLANVILDSIPDSSYIFIYSIKYGEFSNFPDRLFDAFQALGSDSLILRDRPNRPFAFLAKKGDPQSVVEYVGKTIDEVVSFKAKITGLTGLGTIESPISFKANKWNRVELKLDELKEDEVSIDVLGVNEFNGAINRFSFKKLPEILNAPLNTIADDYDRIKLNLETINKVNNSVTGIESWLVTGEFYPEYAIDLSHENSSNTLQDTLQEGQIAEYHFGIANLSQFKSDTIELKYIIEDNNKQRTVLEIKKFFLRASDKIIDTLKFSTLKRLKTNRIYMELNPIQKNNTRLIEEQTYINNFHSFTLFVTADKQNPILDVTFDGQHIKNKEIISPEPSIKISLQDLNPFLRLADIKDTSNFELFFTYPNLTKHPIYFSGNNEFDFTYSFQNEFENFEATILPKFKVNGIYMLTVKARDKSGNISSENGLQIQFEIIKESSISNVLNYPNPFSTKTHFVFTLTGHEYPDEFTIQIMTITGKVVRNINLLEVDNSLKIGDNITNFYWDGKDDYNQQLANGVYLYTTTVKLNGIEIEHRNTQADNGFSRGYGKIYLLK